MSGPLRVLIADDELLARQRLARLLEAMEGVEVVGAHGDAAAVLARVREGGVDALLLDIDMPGLTGLDAVALLPADGPCVIFCTAHPEHAVAAFDAGAVDYLLKPVEAGRLQRALDRARQREGRARPDPGPAGLERLAIPTARGVLLLDPLSVSHAVLEGELVTLHTPEGPVLTDFTLNQLEARLPADRFVRVHRRALLNLDHVTRLEPLDTGGYTARTRQGQAVEVSRQAARELRRRLGLRKAAEEGGTG